jgi:hypothetical protein
MHIFSSHASAGKHISSWMKRSLTPGSNAPTGVSGSDQALLRLAPCSSPAIVHSVPHISPGTIWELFMRPSKHWRQSRSSSGWFRSLGITSSQQRSWHRRYANKCRCAEQSLHSNQFLILEDVGNRNSKRIARVTSKSAFKLRNSSRPSRASCSKRGRTKRLNSSCRPMSRIFSSTPVSDQKYALR